jgi:hypothetical protein
VNVYDTGTQRLCDLVLNEENVPETMVKPLLRLAKGAAGMDNLFELKCNHISVWRAVFWLFFRKMPYLLNFLSTPSSLTLLKTCHAELWLHFRSSTSASSSCSASSTTTSGGA